MDCPILGFPARNPEGNLAARSVSEARLAAGRTECAAGSEGGGSGVSGTARLTGSAAGCRARSTRATRSADSSAGYCVCGGAEHEFPQLVLLLVLIDLDAGTLVRTRDA